MKIIDTDDITKFLYIYIDMKDDNALIVIDNNDTSFEFSIEDDEFAIMMKLSSISGNPTRFKDLIDCCRKEKEIEILFVDEIRKEVDSQIINSLKGMI